MWLLGTSSRSLSRWTIISMEIVVRALYKIYASLPQRLQQNRTGKIKKITSRQWNTLSHWLVVCRKRIAYENRYSILLYGYKRKQNFAHLFLSISHSLHFGKNNDDTNILLCTWHDYGYFVINTRSLISDWLWFLIRSTETALRTLGLQVFRKNLPKKTFA